MLSKQHPSGNIIGIDEAGRGAWAGPLVGAAVYLQRNIDGLKDSKLLDAKRREDLYSQIIQNSYYVIIALDVGVINEVGVHKANLRLFEMLSKSLTRSLPLESANRILLIFDGYRPNRHCHGVALKQGDKKVPAISAASILAKVYRDRLMCKELAPLYPQYHFGVHKGYGTRLHQEALAKYGPSRAHRVNYKPILRLNNILYEQEATD